MKKVKIEKMPGRNKTEELMKMYTNVNGKDFLFYSNFVPLGTCDAVSTATELTEESAQHELIGLLVRAYESEVQQ